MIQGIQNVSFTGGKSSIAKKGIDIIQLAAEMPKALPAPKPYTVDTFVSASSVHSDVDKYSKKSANDLVAHLFSIGRHKPSTEMSKTNSGFSDILAEGYGYTNPASFTKGHSDGGRSLFLNA